MKKQRNRDALRWEGGKALPLFLEGRTLKAEPTIVVRRPIRGLSQRALTAFVAQACRAAKLKGAVTVMVTDSREMRSLNSRFRGKKQATDVLSFPPPALGNGFAGDIAVSLDIAARNARSLGHSLGQEVQILVLHGVLHLAGYDHEGDQGEMAGREVRLRRRFGLPTGLIERSKKSGDRVIG
jgi:probable rRNA maturation factor